VVTADLVKDVTLESLQAFDGHGAESGHDGSLLRRACSRNKPIYDRGE
jgi:hypothetical protein